MNLKDQLTSDLKTAMKAGDKLRVSVIRLLRAKIEEQEIAKLRDLTEDEFLSVLISAAKQRVEAAEQYERGGRDDLAQKERAEKDIIDSYLPQQLTEAELKTIVFDAVTEVGDVEPRQKFGAVMKIVMSRVKGQADGKTVNQLVRSALEG